MKKVFNKLQFTKIMQLEVGEIQDLPTTHSPGVAALQWKISSVCRN